MSLTLSQIRDQMFAVETLERAISSGKVHHAYLFEGPSGVGKSNAALALAMHLNCIENAGGCTSCAACRRIRSGNHPDVRVLSTLEGKHHISIDQVREAERWFAIAPHEARAKFLIIEPADAMTESAANALLKTLEEPRPGNYLILVTAMSQGLLPTVRSRCQNVRFNALQDETVAELLTASGMDEGAAQLLAALAGGSMTKAVQYSGDGLDARMNAVSMLLDGAAQRTPESAMTVAESLRADKDEVLAVLELFLRLLEELLWFRARQGEGAEHSPLMQRFGRTVIELTRTGSVQGTTRHIAAVNRAMTAMKRNNMNSQLAIEAMILAMRNRVEDES